MPNQHTIFGAPTPAQRFWSKVTFTDTCWLWNAAIGGGGYGAFKLAARQGVAHRFAYEFCVGPIPEGLTIDHLCRVRNCVNPDHLEPVTMQTNVLRGETFTAENAAKTECIRGHPFDDANTYHYRGMRKCRACGRLWMRDASRRKKQAFVVQSLERWVLEHGR